MKKLSKEKRDRIILTAMGTVIGVVAIWYGLISSQKASLEEIGKAIFDQRNQVGNAERMVTQSAQIQQDVERANQQLRAIENKMAYGDKYSWFIQTLNNFLTSYGYRDERKVDIPQFSREVKTKVGILADFPYEAVMFTVRGTAYYHDFGKFVADFENAFPLLRVQNINLEPAVRSVSTNVGDPEKLSFKMEIVALIKPGL